MAKRWRNPVKRPVKLAPSGGTLRDANVHFEAGRINQAEAICHRLLEGTPNHADALHLLALICKNRGDNATCIALANNAISVNAKRPVYYNTLGGAFFESGKTAHALASFRQALALNGRFAPANNNLGSILFQLGDVAGAVDCFRKATRSEPKRANSRVNLAHALIELGDIDGAIASAKHATRLNPNFVQAYVALGNALKAKGEFEDAKVAYRRAIEIDPDEVEAYFGAIELEPVKPGDSRLAKLEALRSKNSLPLNQEIHLQFALGKIYSGLARHNDAFAAYQRGNALRNKQAMALGQRFDAASHRRRVDSLINTFTANFFETRQDFGHESELPVFVVGMPRSGTSLVEQIIASHPRVHGGGELPHIGQIVARRATGVQFADWVAKMPTKMASDLGRGYVESLSELAPGAARICDKMPGNYLFLGLIAVILPQARIIHCRREPLDTCLSCYFHNFTHRHLFSNDLADLAVYHRQYERVMAHWSIVLPIPILHVDYEALVADQEEKSREIIEFLGLEWDDRCLHFYENKRVVNTASNVQVRQKMYGASIGRWRDFKMHLKPLIESLGRMPPMDSKLG